MEKQTQKKKLLKLKPKEKEFVKTLVNKNNENGTETVKEVFGIENDGYARLKAHRLITKDNVSQAIVAERETLRSALEKKGITATKVAETIGELLDATDEKGNKDYTAKDKGLKHTLNILGIEDSEKPKENVYNFFFEPQFQQNIRSYDENLKNLILNKDENNKQD